MPLIHLLQLASGLLWGAIAIWLSTAFVRLFARRGYRYDLFRSCLFFMGVLQAGFTVRWRMYPHSIAHMPADELVMWQGLYLLSCVLALWVAYVARTYGRGERL